MGDWGHNHRVRGTGLACAQRDADAHAARQRITPAAHEDRVHLAQRDLIQSAAHAKSVARLLAEHATNTGDALLIESIAAQLARIAIRLRVAEEPKPPMYKAGE